MNIIIPGVNAIVLFLVSFFFYRRSSELKVLFWPALLLKITSGIMLGLIYTYYYTAGDTFYFFNDGVTLANVFKEDFKLYVSFLWHGDDTFECWQFITNHDSRSLFLVKFVSFLNVITNSNYWITAFYFSLISFLSSWYLLQILVKYFPAQKVVFAIACLFIPTVGFWSSGIIKESLELVSLFLIISIFLKFWMRDRVTVLDLLILIFSTWILWQVKYYYAAIVIPVIITAVFVHRFVNNFIKNTNPVFELAIWLAVFLIPIAIVTFLHPNFYAGNFLNVIVKNYYAYMKYSRPDAIIHYSHLHASLGSVLLNSPWALFSCLFRPFLWEATNLFQLSAAIENSLLLILTLFALPRFKNIFLSEHRLLFISMIVYVGMLGIFLALSAPNFGTLSRFRIGFIPVYFILISVDSPVIERIRNFAERTFSRLAR